MNKLRVQVEGHVYGAHEWHETDVDLRAMYSRVRVTLSDGSQYRIGEDEVGGLVVLIERGPLGTPGAGLSVEPCGDNRVRLRGRGRG